MKMTDKKWYVKIGGEHTKDQVKKNLLKHKALKAEKLVWPLVLAQF